MKRGEVWWVDLPDPAGSAPGYRRPVIIVQANAFNRSRIGTILAVVVTSNLNLAKAPGNVFLKSNATGLPKDSVANVSQVITLDRNFFIEKVGEIKPELCHQLDMGLRLALDL